MEVCYRPCAVSAPKASSDKLVYTKCLIFEYRAAHFKRCLPPAEEFPYYRSRGSLEYPSSSRLGCAALSRRLIPHMKLSPARSTPYLRLRVCPTHWTPSDTIHHNMNLVQNRGAPGFYFPSSCTWRESFGLPRFLTPLRLSCN